MKRSASIFIIIILIVAILPVYSVFGMSTLSDWAKDDYEFANQLGIIPERFINAELKDNVTREEFCEVALNLYKRISGKDVANTTGLYFKDTYSDKVSAAYELKLISGRDNGLFAPDDPITRQEISKILENILVACAIDLPVSTNSEVLGVFPDSNSISDWARAPMSTMVKNEVIRGVDEFLAPRNNVTREQALIISARFYRAFKIELKYNVSFTKPKIILPTDRAIVDNTKDLIVGWMNDTIADKYALYLYDLDSGSNSYKTKKETTNTITIIPQSELLAGKSYAVCVAALYQDGAYMVYSDFYIINAGENFKPIITNKQEMNDDSRKSGRATINWKTFDPLRRCVIEVYENKLLKNSVVADGLDSYTVNSLKDGADYKIQLYGKDDSGNKTKSFDTVVINIPTATPPPVSADLSGAQKYNRIFGDGDITTEAQAWANMKTIKINVWDFDKKGNKVATTKSLTVNKNIAGDVYNVFQEIFNGAEKFPIKSVGSYNWRPPMESGRLSHHNYGTAIDINPDENYCLYNDGSFIGRFWHPKDDPYSITADGDVVRAFARYGFKWGGTWNNPKDYMHFSYLGL